MQGCRRVWLSARAGTSAIGPLGLQALDTTGLAGSALAMMMVIWLALLRRNFLPPPHRVVTRMPKCAKDHCCCQTTHRVAFGSIERQIHTCARLLLPPFGLILLLHAVPVWAFIDPPYITPPAPTSADTIVVNVYRGVCDVFDIGIVPPLVERQGDHILVVATGIHQDDPEWCYFGTGTETLPIGTYPPGSYVLEVDRRYQTVFGPWIQETLGIIPFTVAAGATTRPFSTPTLSPTGIFSLLIALIGAASFALRSLRGHFAKNG